MTGLLSSWFKRQKRRIAALLAIFLLFSQTLHAAPTPPNPGDNILIIYNDDTAVGNGSYDSVLKDNIVSALSAMSPAGIVPTITLLPVLTTDIGIWAAMQRHSPVINDFSAYCQVWDVRFKQPTGGGGSTPCTPAAYDTLTLTGANNDQSLYQTFLNQGGHLMLLGDNYGFCSRNQNLVQFINNVISSGTFGAPWYNFTQYENFNVIDNTAPDLFRTDYANLTGVSISTNWPGQIIVGGAADQSGGGKVLIQQTGTPDANTYALSLMWSASQMRGGSGQLATFWDTNTIEELRTGYLGVVQNLYTTLSTCYNVNLTKSQAASTITVCDQAVYTLCYHNTGTRTVPSASLWDTISTCLSFNSSSPAYSTVSGNVYTWDLGPVAGGATACVTVTLDVLQVPPCP
jgi:uncharacterized repeat protein (TIGR01451 family)